MNPAVIGVIWCLVFVALEAIQYVFFGGIFQLWIVALIANRQDGNSRTTKTSRYLFIMGRDPIDGVE